jgi:hypothetical protein
MEAKNFVIREPILSHQRNGAAEPRLSLDAQAQIGRRLRIILTGDGEPTPDRLQALLAQIDARLTANEVG